MVVPTGARYIEWPTVLLGLVIYGCFAALTYFFHDLPLWLGLPAAAFVITWQSSLQHECVHGHPTSSPRLNAIFAGLSLWLYLPFLLYRESHLAHHASERLTSPYFDTESYYFGASAWSRFGRAERIFWTAHNTLLGRFVLGPPVVLVRVLKHEWRAVKAGDRERLGVWAVHALVVALILLWATRVCELHVWEYLLYFMYPGMALSLLRSFAEHRPADRQDLRTAIIEAHPLFALLFLHNNLHALHHEEPYLPWYDCPARYRVRRDELLARNGGLLYEGYGQIARRYFVRPLASPRHPFD